MGMLLLGLLVVAGTVQCAHAFEAYDCSQPRLSGEYALSKTTECEEATPTNVESHNMVYYLYEKKDVTAVRVNECELTLQEVIFYCGMHSHTSIVESDMYPETERVSAQECTDFFLRDDSAVMGLVWMWQ